MEVEKKEMSVETSKEMEEVELGGWISKRCANAADNWDVWGFDVLIWTAKLTSVLLSRINFA